MSSKCARFEPERCNLRLARHPPWYLGMRFGVEGRMRHTGAVEVPLDLASSTRRLTL